jgi:hypothetical protein
MNKIKEKDGSGRQCNPFYQYKIALSPTDKVVAGEGLSHGTNKQNRPWSKPTDARHQKK